jgi:hypothetical protein
MTERDHKALRPQQEQAAMTPRQNVVLPGSKRPIQVRRRWLAAGGAAVVAVGVLIAGGVYAQTGSSAHTTHASAGRITGSGSDVGSRQAAALGGAAEFLRDFPNVAITTVAAREDAGGRASSRASATARQSTAAAELILVDSVGQAAAITWAMEEAQQFRFALGGSALDYAVTQVNDAAAAQAAVRALADQNGLRALCGLADIQVSDLRTVPASAAANVALPAVSTAELRGHLTSHTV